MVSEVGRNKPGSCLLLRRMDPAEAEAMARTGIGGNLITRKGFWLVGLKYLDVPCMGFYFYGFMIFDMSGNECGCLAFVRKYVLIYTKFATWAV